MRRVEEQTTVFGWERGIDKRRSCFETFCDNLGEGFLINFSEIVTPSFELNFHRIGRFLFPELFRLVLVCEQVIGGGVLVAVATDERFPASLDRETEEVG